MKVQYSLSNSHQLWDLEWHEPTRCRDHSVWSLECNCDNAAGCHQQPVDFRNVDLVSNSTGHLRMNATPMAKTGETQKQWSHQIKFNLHRQWKKSPVLVQGHSKETYIDMDVSENSGTPKSSTLIGFSIINHPFWGIFPYFWKHPYINHKEIQIADAFCKASSRM